jgi:hypothetical protein
MIQRYSLKIYCAFSFILFLAVALRLYNLGSLSFWHDEAIAMQWANNPGYLFKSDNCIPPLYFLIVHYWKSFGYSEFILRLLSVIFGVGSVVGIYFLAKLFFDIRTALISSFILAISPLHILYSRELTPYSLWVFLVLLFIYFLKKALESGKWRFWFAFALFSALGILTHYITILILFSEILYFLLFRQRYRHLFNKWLKGHLLILAFLSPWLRLIILQLISGVKIHLGFWIPELSLQAIAVSFKNFSIGYNATPKIFFAALALYLSLFALGMRSVNKKSDLMLLLFIIFIPMLCAFVLLKFKISVYSDRHFLPNSLLYYIIVAGGVSTIKNKYSLSGLIMAVIILNGFSLKNYYLNYLPNAKYHHIAVQRNPDFKSAARYIAVNFKKGDGIIHTNDNSILPLEYYLNSQYCCGLKYAFYFSEESHKRLWAKFSDNFNSIKVIKYIPTEEIPDIDSFFKKEGVYFEQYSRIWLVVHMFEGPRKDIISFLDWMDKHYEKSDYKGFYGLDIYLYDKIGMAK